MLMPFREIDRFLGAAGFAAHWFLRRVRGSWSGRLDRAGRGGCVGSG